MARGQLTPDFDPLVLLDEPDAWQAFSREDAKHAGCWESNVVIEGMHCAACALTIEQALKQVPGVSGADVSAGSHRAKVRWSSEHLNPSDWMRAVQAAGYRVLPANDAFARELRQAQARKALWRMMVAGVCMMQVMMYAYPAYVAKPGDLSAEMEQLLRWASWVLTLPVMLFSCGPFFSSAWRDLSRRQVSMDLPVALGMLITFVVSTIGTFEPQGLMGRQVYFDSLTMFVFFLLTGRYLELRLRERTAGALEALMNRMPDSVLRQGPNGVLARVALRQLKPGDVVQVLPGEAFPADGPLLQGRTNVDEALLTGESRALLREAGQPVIAGSYNLSAPVLMRVEALGDDTRFAQVVALMQSASASKPQVARLADALAKPFLLGVLLLAGLACAFWWRTDPEQALMVAVAVLVVTCPCALSLATPAAMLSAAGALARRGVLVRELNAIEALASVDTVVFDKTGTLTQDTMALRAVEVRTGRQNDQVLSLAAAMATQSLHPASRALVEAAKQKSSQPGAWRVTDLKEVVGQGLAAHLQSPDAASAPQRYRLGSSSFCGVAVAPSESAQVVLADEQGWLATFELQEALRDDAPTSVRALKQVGVQVRLLSGDGPDAVHAVAHTLGIEQARAQCAPQDKLEAVGELQAQGRRVAMVGDGLNDGPVLAVAQTSFSLGQALPLAQSQADFWVSSGHVSDVVRALKLARQTMRVVRQNLGWALAYNLVGIPLAALGWLPAWLAGLGMAASSLLVVLNALRLSKHQLLTQPMEE
jgi:Cu2+-exporting ATPase